MSSLLLVVAACGGDSETVETTAAVGTTAAQTTAAPAETTVTESATTAAAGEEAFDAEAFFGGTTIQMIIPHSAGGNTDIFGRFFADRLGAFIPGEPRIAVTNSDGLGGIANIFDAPAEDLVIGATSRSSALYGTSDDPAAAHVPSEIKVIGGVAGDPRAWTAFGVIVDSYESLADASGAEEPALRFAATVGGPGEIESDVLLFSWLCENMDLPCEYISVADDSSSDTNLMVQRGEVNIQGGTMITMMRDYLADIQDGTARLLLEYAQTEGEQIPLPDGVESESILEVLPEELHEEFNRILPAISSGLLGTMLWTGPEFPDPALQVLREAFAELVSDPEVLSDLNTIMAGGDSPYEYRVTPMVGDEAQAAFDESSEIFAENFDFINELRTEYWENHWLR